MTSFQTNQVDKQICNNQIKLIFTTYSEHEPHKEHGAKLTLFHEGYMNTEPKVELSSHE